MKLTIKDIVGIHENKPAVFCGHGPSLNSYKQQIETLQKKDKLIRFSVNDWYLNFETPPNYWILSNTNFNISDMFIEMNRFGSPIFYSIEGDPTPESFIEANLECDYLPYDQRHFKGHNCIGILHAFKEFYEKNKSYDFKGYGNNAVMWHPPRIGPAGFAGFDPYSRCCPKKIEYESTIQETLQGFCNHGEHYSTADTVAFHALGFAILMGCNPIYITGMDLDYSRGYANNNKPLNMDHYTIWQDSKENLLNDMRIINESAKNKNIRIVNLNKDSWHKEFEIGVLDEL